MSAQQLELAQLLASRICHDLISPISAVNNGLEMMVTDADSSSDSIDMQNRAMELVVQSAQVASAKLQIMRCAFGSGQSLDETSSIYDIEKLILPILEHNKITLRWLCHCDVTFSRNEAKLLLNLLLVSCEALPRGGDISVQSEDMGMYIELFAEKIIFPQEKQDFLCHSLNMPTDPRYVGLYLVRLLAQFAQKHKISIGRADNKLQIVVTQ